MKKKNERLQNNIKIYNDIDAIQNHIQILSEQNKKLMNSLNLIKETEDKLNEHFERKKKYYSNY